MSFMEEDQPQGCILDHEKLAREKGNLGMDLTEEFAFLKQKDMLEKYLKCGYRAKNVIQ